MPVRNYIALAIPFFLIFIGLEVVIARARRRRGLYRLADALPDLGCGVGPQGVMVFAGGGLGPLELVLNTPSHHRVHHAVNPQYLDRNYGAILIVWDRLFGTFAEEREPAVYGTTKPIRSFDPAWAQLQPWFEIAAKARALPRLRDRLRLWVSSPAWNPGAPPPPTEAELRARPKHDPPLGRALGLYALVQFAPLIAATFLMLLWQYTAPLVPLVVCAALAFFTLASLGALMDRRAWALPVEIARLLAVAVAAVGARP